MKQLKHRFKNSAYILAFSLCLPIGSVGAAQDSENNSSVCTTTAIERANNNFGSDANGVPASEKTSCIKNRHNLKAIVAWNSDNVHPSKNGLQVLNARNILNDWEESYQLKAGKDFDVVIVSYGKGARWAINDAAYKEKFGTDNPSTIIVKSLIERGAKLYMCQNSMKGNGWKTTDLIDGVNMVPSGVTAVIDFQYQGYKYIAP